MTSRSPIVVDDRQKTPPSNVRVEELRACGVPSTVARLPVADYRWEVTTADSTEQHLVEEKLIADFLNSVRDGRLMRFVNEGEGSRLALLLIGTYVYGGEFEGRHWTPDSIDNMLVSLQTSGVVVLHCPSPEKAAARLAAYWHYTGSDQHRTLDRPVRPELHKWYLDPRKRDAVRLLMCLPEIGEVRANALLAEHGTIDGVLHCFSENDACKAEGVGPKTVLAGRAFVRQTYSG